jgi:hypothetical protein
LSLLATGDDCDVPDYHSWGNEPDKKPEVGVINAENLRYKFADRFRFAEKQRPAYAVLPKFALVICFLSVQACGAVDSALSQFTL